MNERQDPNNHKRFMVDEDNAYRGGEEIEFQGVHFLVCDPSNKEGEIVLRVDGNAYMEESDTEINFDWDVRTLLENTDFNHTDAYGNPGDKFEVTLTTEDVVKAKTLIEEFKSLQSELED